MHYKYPKVKIIIDELIKDIDVKKYFNNKDYENNELYFSLKGYFFEYASINQINLLKNKIFEELIEYSLTVKNILCFKPYESNNVNAQDDTFKMILDQLENKNISPKEITKKDLLNKKLKLIN